MRTTIWRLIMVIALLGLIVFVARSAQHRAEESRDNLRAWFFDVGQGDSILLDTPDQRQILIDGGPNSSILRELSRALPLDDKEIDLVISTHNDSDHLAGLNKVLKHYKIGKIWLTGAINPTQTFQKFVGLIKEKSISTETVKAGTKVTYGQLAGIVISPFDDFLGIQPSKQNETSIVTFWQFGSQTILLTADIDQNQEQELLSRNVLRPVDILKVTHHGSRTSSSETFLQAVKPKIAIIQVGAKNRYGHPTSVILDRLKSLSIPILRTDQNGTVRCDIKLQDFFCATR
mgnify:FL=1